MCWASGNGVSPRAAGLGWAWHGDARPGAAWYGPARAAMAARRAFGPSLPPSLVDEAWRSLVRQGKLWHGAARRNSARVTDGGTESFGFPCHPQKGGRGSAWQVRARQGVARPGRGLARPARPRAADSSTGGFGSHCCSLWRADAARFGAAGRGSAGLVEARQGSAWHGLQTAARSFFRGSLLLSLEGSRGWIRPGEVGAGPARPGEAGRGAARADDLSTEGANPPCWVHSTHLKA